MGLGDSSVSQAGRGRTRDSLRRTAHHRQAVRHGHRGPAPRAERARDQGRYAGRRQVDLHGVLRGPAVLRTGQRADGTAGARRRMALERRGTQLAGTDRRHPDPHLYGAAPGWRRWRPRPRCRTECRPRGELPAEDRRGPAGVLHRARHSRSRGHPHRLCPLMIVIHTVSEVRQHLNDQRAAGRTVGMVATTGSLHEGHLSLVRRAKAENDVAVMFWSGGLNLEWARGSSPSYSPDMARDLALVEANGLDVFFSLNRADLFAAPSSTSRT